jgi:hypothetical protein
MRPDTLRREVSMKAIPMRGRLKGKRLAGFIWAGPGRSFHKKENYFQLEHESIVSAWFAGPSGAAQLRFRGGSLEVVLMGKEQQVLSTVTLQFPGGRKARP